MVDAFGAGAGVNGPTSSGSPPCLYSSALALPNAQLSSSRFKTRLVENSHVNEL